VTADEPTPVFGFPDCARGERRAQTLREEPGNTLIEVPGNNGQVASKPFSQCSVDKMRRALQHKRKPASSKPLPPGAVELGEQYHAALKALFPKATTVQVQVRNIKSKAVVDFQGIPLEQVRRLTEVLSDELPPVPAVSCWRRCSPRREPGARVKWRPSSALGRAACGHGGLEVGSRPGG
jgi:hypothetical protein